ncbi:NADH:flavin oxidoreductase/NADH oxidase family protein [Saccharospirillum mangrovi]|uniref:NADH:flavin oxidoreductase/NADH oxidase family protein n=1 Tax=Saccharospirillum mangrovi TaxID=2161747 RepID=UPI000D3CE048|nr:NADH:flavin oxidoreductase/NADH oxidase family protein [Saccharospirillum mangrovi]
MSSVVFESLTLPNGQTLNNRLVKAAMEERLANAQLLPDDALITLYRRWSAGGTGLLLTGNVMVDARAMTGPANVALEAKTDLQPFQRWSAAAHEGGAKIWMQINHPGRQVMAKQGGIALSASDVAVDLGRYSKLFAQPKAMTEADIQDVIQRFVATATQAEAAGFDGVEVHAAHGYLLSQFLSPLTNRRNDQWGGSLPNRARLLLEIVQQIRAVVRPEFAVAVKLNSADFQRGGFEFSDALDVVKLLNPLGLDAIEVSGGNYEAPAMQGQTGDQRTLAREAYFLAFAQQIAQVSSVPVISTGGISRLATAEAVVQSGVHLVGLGRALAVCPDLSQRWRTQPHFQPRIDSANWNNKALASLANMAMARRFLRYWSGRRNRAPSFSTIGSFVLGQLRDRQQLKRYRRFLQQR